MEIVAETGSTNADLAARLRAGEQVPEGHWLVADRQTAGRGRQGRTWFDGAGNFLASTVVQVVQTDPPPATLALVAGLAVHEAVAPLVPPPHRAELKWPNDLLIGGAKLSGILLERFGEAVVVGIGVNLAAAPDLPDRKTIALTQFGPTPDRDAFALTLARQFTLELIRWRNYGIDSIIKRWLAAAHPVGTQLIIADAALVSPFVTFHGLAADGALQVRLADGTVRTIHAGEVHLAEPG